MIFYDFFILYVFTSEAEKAPIFIYRKEYIYNEINIEILKLKLKFFYKCQILYVILNM